MLPKSFIQFDFVMLLCFMYFWPLVVLFSTMICRKDSLNPNCLDPWCGLAKVFWHLASQHNGSLIPGQERFSPFQSLNVFSRIQGSDTFSLHSLHTCWNPFNSLSKWEPSLWRGMRRGPWGRPRMSQLLQNYLLRREEKGAQNAGTAQNMSSWIIEVQTNYCYFQLILQFHLFCST